MNNSKSNNSSEAPASAGAGAASGASAQAPGTGEVHAPAVSGAVEKQREFAQQALAEYNKGNYDDCSKILEKLEKLKSHDLKITLNSAIVDFKRSADAKRIEVMIKKLQGISESAKDTDPLEKCNLHYNQAIGLYHLGQYHSALQIANSLFLLIEPMDEHLVYKVCLLLIELYVVMGKPDTALAMIDYAENHMSIAADPVKITLGEQNQKQETAGKTAAKIVASSPSAATGDKDAKKNNNTEINNFKMKLLTYKLKLYLKTLQIKNYKKKVKVNNQGMQLTPANNATSTIFMKANYECLRKNYQKAIKILNSIDKKSVLDFKVSGESVPVLYYNNMASIHFAMGKPNLACYYLKVAINENKKAVESLHNPDNVNNADSKLQPPIYTHNKSKHYQLMYSLGVSFLYAGQAAKAFDCFIEAAQQFHNESRLWLRMAECCIYCHKPSNKIGINILEGQKNLVTAIIGEKNENCAISRKYILNNTLSKTYTYGHEGLSFAIPQPTLEYGMLCLKNALFLLPKSNYEETNLPMTNLSTGEGIKKMAENLSASGNQKLANNNSMMNANSNQNSSIQITQCQQTLVENLNLKISILTASAYVSLCLGDYVSSLEYSKSLLSMTQLPGAQKLLGNLYAAESLIYLDRISEALNYLKPEELEDINTFIPIKEVIGDKEDHVEEMIDQKSSKDLWYPSDMSSTKAILRYNIAVAHAIRGELDRSTDVLKKIWSSSSHERDIPIHVIMLAIYIELQHGNTDTARNLISRHYCPTLPQRL